MLTLISFLQKYMIVLGRVDWLIHVQGKSRKNSLEVERSTLECEMKKRTVDWKEVDALKDSMFSLR